jgi:hypothetical protein
MITDIEAALEARLLTLSGETIAWWGRPFSPTKGQAYITAQIAARAASPMGVGASSPELWQGTLQLLVAHPMNEGPKPARIRAEAVRDHFPRGLTLVQGAARVIIETRSIQPAYAAIDWNNYPVLIGWFAEEIPA